MARTRWFNAVLAGTTLALSWHAQATVPAGTQLTVNAVDKLAIKAGEYKKVKFKVAPAESWMDPESATARMAGCTIEGDAAFNPRSGRLYIKKPVLTCDAETTKMGAAFLGGDISGQIGDAGVDGLKLDCPKPNECTIGNLKPGAEAIFRVTETLGGGN